MRARSTIWPLSNAANGIPRLKSPILKRSSHNIRNHAMRGGNWASPTTSSIAATKPWQQFKALQAIDPDDLAAHYNLSILYRRMGMKKQAAEAGCALRDKKNRSRRADLFAGLSAQASRDFHRKRSMARAFRHERTPPASRVRPAISRKDVRLMKRRAFIRSLSRTALVLPFADILALASPFSSKPRRPPKPIGPQERSYDAKPAPPPPGPKSPIEGTPLGVSFVDVVHESGLNVKTIYGGEVTNKYLLETTGCGSGFLRLRQRWLAGSLSGQRLAAGGLSRRPGAALPSVQEQSRRNLHRCDHRLGPRA